MKKQRNLLVFVFLVLISYIFPVVNADTKEYKPTSKFYINDFANILSSSSEDTVFNTSRSIDENTTAQVVVTTIPSIPEGYDIDSYANTLFNEWKIGNKENNNGLLILISSGERKIRVEVGYGLEGALPDSKVGRVLDKVAVPYLKNNDYDTAVVNLVNEFKAIIYNEYGIEGGVDNYADEEKESSIFSLITTIIFLIIFIILPLIFSRGRGIFFFGGPFFGGRGGFGRRRLWRWFIWWWLISAVVEVLLVAEEHLEVFSIYVLSHLRLYIF